MEILTHNLNRPKKVSMMTVPKVPKVPKGAQAPPRLPQAPLRLPPDCPKLPGGGRGKPAGGSRNRGRAREVKSQRSY